LTLPVDAELVASAAVDGEAVDVTGLDIFGWPSTLVPVELPADEDQTRTVSLELRTP
jgi:hypothetical protein